MSDALYGMTPDKSEDFGLSLGTLAPRGERNVLVASLDALLRASSNPFFPYLLQAHRGRHAWENGKFQRKIIGASTSVEGRRSRRAHS